MIIKIVAMIVKIIISYNNKKKKKKKKNKNKNKNNKNLIIT